MAEEKKMEVKFAPGCFDDFEGTQEELNEFMALIRQMVEDRTLLEQSVPIEDGDLPEEVVEKLNRLYAEDSDRNKKLN
jgi:hypothetical protein